MERVVDYGGLLKALLAALFGVASFFAIIGVFGMEVSIASLGAFVVLALSVFFNSQQAADSDR